jgi:uncharacterized protein (TIGR03118 family)
MTFPLQSSMLAAVSVVALVGMAGEATAGYLQTNLVSDISGLAELTDPVLLNPWGVSHSAGSPVWVSDQGSSDTTLYSVNSLLKVSKVTAVNPPTGDISVQGGPPTGQVNNGNMSAFLVGNGGNGKSAHFIFATLGGAISAWDTGPHTFSQITVAGASFTGLAINQAQNTLYAANDAGTGGSIDVFNSSFVQCTTACVGQFTNPFASKGLVPFNVQDIGGTVYVTYAPSGHLAQTTATAGEGGVALFTESGVLISSFTNNHLAAPWGVALAPSTGFGVLSGDLLVGNFAFGDSEVNAFNPVTDAFEGSIPIDVGTGNTAGGLWSLDFGTGGGNGGPDILFFTDGINGEKDGLFGAITASEPPAVWLLGAALALVGIWRYSPPPRRRA